MDHSRETDGKSITRDPNTRVTKILLIEDNEDDAALFREALLSEKEALFDLAWVYRLSAGLKHLETEKVDVIMLDLGLPDSMGADTLKRVLQHSHEVPVVVLTGLNDTQVALEMVQIGAQDNLVKGQMEDQLLVRTIRYAIERHRLRAQVEQTSNKLRASELRLRTIIEQSADGIIVVDRDGFVRFVNPAAESLLGHASEELVDQLLGFPLTGAEATDLELTGAGLEARQIELRVVETKWEGQVAYLATLRDITARVRAEKALKVYSELLEDRVKERTKELQDAQEQLVRREKLAVLGQLAGGIGHELRNPLGAIKNAVYYSIPSPKVGNCSIREVPYPGTNLILTGAYK